MHQRGVELQFNFSTSSCKVEHDDPAVAWLRGEASSPGPIALSVAHILSRRGTAPVDEDAAAAPSAALAAVGADGLAVDTFSA